MDQVVRRISLTTTVSHSESSQPDEFYYSLAPKLAEELVSRIAREMVLKKVHTNDPVNLCSYTLDAVVLTPEELTDLIAKAVAEGAETGVYWGGSLT